MHIKVIEDNKLADDDSEGWAAFTLDILGYVPDAVFTSEAYGDPYASFMGSTHVLVDKARTFIPISATIVRKDSRLLQLHSLETPKVRALFLREECVCSAQSPLVQRPFPKALAQYYKTVWSTRIRSYVFGRKKRMQARKRNGEAKSSLLLPKSQERYSKTFLQNLPNGLVIADTDPFATSLWHERYMNSRSSEVGDSLLRDAVMISIS